MILTLSPSSKKRLHRAHFHFVIVDINARTDLDFLDFDDLLLFARFGLFLLRLVFHPAKINDLADRQLVIMGVAGDDHQVHPGFLSHGERGAGVDFSVIVAFGIDQLDAGSADVTVGLWAALFGGGGSEWTANGRCLLDYFGKYEMCRAICVLSGCCQ